MINSNLGSKLTNAYSGSTNSKQGIKFDTNADGSWFALRPYLPNNILQITKNDSSSLFMIDSAGNVTIEGEISSPTISSLKQKRNYVVKGGFFNPGGGGSVVGNGVATISISPNGTARIDYSLKITKDGTLSNNLYYGINRDLLKILNSDIPTITPISGGKAIVYNSDGTLNTNLNGMGMMHNARTQFWNLCRLYTVSTDDNNITTGTTGEWFETELKKDMYIIGTCYGTV